jgi:hypothetical protein
MRDLKEEFIKGLSSGCSSVCPESIGLENEDCDDMDNDCEMCWRDALKNIDIIERKDIRE